MLASIKSAAEGLVTSVVTEIRELVRQYKPERLDDLDTLLYEFEGQEREMLQNFDKLLRGESLVTSTGAGASDSGSNSKSEPAIDPDIDNPDNDCDGVQMELLQQLTQLCFEEEQWALTVHALIALLAKEPNNTDGVRMEANTRQRLGPLPQWHVMVSNDNRRNEMYAAAITRAVSEVQQRQGADVIVLQSGAGSGLLSMLAVQAGARHVYVFEGDASVALSAAAVVRQNGMSQAITVIPKPLSQATVGRHGDMPRLADLMLADVTDNTVIGDQLTPAARHAQRVLLQTGAPVIPAAAELWGAIEAGRFLRRRFQLRDTRHENEVSEERTATESAARAPDAEQESHAFDTSAMVDGYVTARGLRVRAASPPCQRRRMRYQAQKD